MANRKRVLYSIDDYIQDRQARTAQSAIRIPAGVQYQRGGSAYASPASYVASPAVKETVVRPGQGLNGSAVIEPSKSVSYSPALPEYKASGVSTQQQNVGVPNPDTSAGSVQAGMQPLTQFEIDGFNMDQARQKVYDILNRKFKYNAKESPLYSILQKQSEREAERAAGQAYARSVANTGGYGSSYATLSAEEARRKSMESMDDQQLALYEAARQEFFDERQSAADWYNQLRTMYEDKLKDMEYEKQMQEQAEREASGVSENTQAFYNYANGIWNGNNVEEVRSALKNQGATDEEAESAISMMRKDEAAKIFDEENAVSGISDAMGFKDSLDAALKNQTLTVQKYDDEIQKNSTKIMNEVYKGVNRPGDVDYTELGYSAEEWNAMEDGDRKLAILDAVGQMAKAGVVTQQDFYKLLYKDLQEEFNSEAYKTNKNKTRNAVDAAMVIQDFFDNGYMNEDLYRSLIWQKIMPEIEDNKTFKSLVYYSPDFEVFGNDYVKAADNISIDFNRSIPDIGIYSKEQKAMLVMLAMNYNGTNLPKKKKR